MSAGRLAKGLCPLSQYFLRRSVSCLTYVKKNGLVDTGRKAVEQGRIEFPACKAMDTVQGDEGR